MYFSDAPQIEEISINKMITKYKNIKPSSACVYCHNGNSCFLSSLDNDNERALKSSLRVVINLSVIRNYILMLHH
jgi:hypothetical protein